MAPLSLMMPSPKLILPKLISKNVGYTSFILFHILLSKSGFIRALKFIPTSCLLLSPLVTIEGERTQTFSKASVLNRVITYPPMSMKQGSPRMLLLETEVQARVLPNIVSTTK